MHHARNEMLLAKENYLSSMQSLHQFKTKQQESKSGGLLAMPKPALTSQLASLENQAIKNEVDYKATIKAFNAKVEEIRSEYRTRLNRVQENDDSQINFIKYIM